MFKKNEEISLKTHHVYPECFQVERSGEWCYEARLVNGAGDVIKSVTGKEKNRKAAKAQCKKWVQHTAKGFKK